DLTGLEIAGRPRHDRAFLVLPDRGHVERPVASLHLAGIADLAAGLGVERIVTEPELQLGPALTEGQDLAVGLGHVIAHEPLPPAANRPPLAGGGRMHRRRTVEGGSRPGTARAFALLFERPLESGGVDGKA